MSKRSVRPYKEKNDKYKYMLHSILDAALVKWLSRVNEGAS